MYGLDDKLLFEHNPSPMFLFDEGSLQILDTNRAATEQYGYSKEEFQKLTIGDLRPEERLNEMHQFFSQEASMTGNIGTWEHMDRDGKRFYVEIHSQRFRDKGRNLKLALVHPIPELSREEVLSHAARYEIQYHLEHASLGVLHWNRNAELQYISPRISNLINRPRKELIGVGILEFTRFLVDPADRQTTQKKLNALLNGSVRKATIDSRFQPSDNQMISLRSHSSALRDKDGRLVSILTIVENLTEIERTRQELKEEADKLRLFIDNSSDMISRHGPDGTYLYVSPAVLHLTGYTPEEMVGKNPYDFLHPDDVHTVQQAHEITLKTDEPKSVELRFRHKDGTYRWLEGVSKAIRYPDSGDIMEIHVSARDITERVRLREELLAEKKFIETAIESLPGIFYMIDENSRYVLWNKNLEHVLECSPEKLKTADPLEFYREEDRERVTEAIRTASLEGEAELEADLVSTRGRATRYYITGRIFENRGNVFVVGSGIDISEHQKQAEALKQSLEEKQVLLREIHHRVKNNLAVISGLLELQAVTVSHPDVRKALGDSQLRIKSMALIHEKLYESRQLSRIPLNRILDDLVQLTLKAIETGSDIRIRTDFDSVELNINQALPATLIINELVSNAFRHAFQGRDQGEIFLQLKQDEEQVHIHVIDDGVGLPDSVLHKEPESMGYTIIHTLASQLNADFSATSNNGSHLQFTFRAGEVKGSSSTHL